VNIYKGGIWRFINCCRHLLFQTIIWERRYEENAFAFKNTDFWRLHLWIRQQTLLKTKKNRVYSLHQTKNTDSSYLFKWPGTN